MDILGVIKESLSSVNGLVAGGGFLAAYDFVLRITKTKKPQCLFRHLASIFKYLSNIFMALAGVNDKVNPLPQNVEKPKAKKKVKKKK